ncbi:MAG: response regulator [Lachnospiraceae bacterium]|nr:response regulator [Lachnospiraceae bacterium]
MNKYSVLLVDDEELVFQIMMDKMDWDSMGFEIVNFANNGIEALEMAQEMCPDVVMTDIKMPYMDGLTLGKKLKEQYPDIKIIILSGFDEFEYAKEAVRMEAEEYLLKPININELTGVFTRIRETLDKENDERRNINMLKQHYLKSLPILRESFYISLLEGRLKAGDIEKFAPDYQVELKGGRFVVSVLKISCPGDDGVEPDVTPFMLTLSIQKLVEEQLRGKYESKVLLYRGDIVVISELSGNGNINDYTDMMDRICKTAYRTDKVKVTAGIGNVCTEPSALRVSYRGARTAVSYRFSYGDMRAINIAEIDVDSTGSQDNSADESIRRIVKNMRRPERDELRYVIEDFVGGIEESHMPLSEYRTLIMRILVALMDFMRDYHIEPGAVFEEGTDLSMIIQRLESTESLKSFLLKSCLTLQDMVSDRRNSTSLSFVTKAEDFVKANYADKDISIEMVCGALNVSAAYFSTVFKKTTGKTFINYLTEYRMDKAVELLETTDGRTYEIADMVGYADPNYFSYVFKKKFGVSPVKYKQNLNPQTNA